MVRVYKTKWLARFTRREKLSDAGLAEAIERAERGLIEADLGGGLIKQRVARAGGGRSGGYRMLVAYRAETRAVFLYGFAKSERENITDDELLSLREIAAGFLGASDEGIGHAVEDGTLQEVAYGDDATEEDDR